MYQTSKLLDFMPEEVLKIEKAKKLLHSALVKHGNKIFVAYSGGKDSKVILHLAQQAAAPMRATVISIHNSHPDEKCDLPNGCVIIKEPKSNFVEFLKYVEVTAQIDGTRTDEEEKTVIFNSEVIPRKDIPNEFNPKGVFGLEIYYPILYWTEKEVWNYIKQHELMTEEEIKNYKPSQPYKEIFL